MRFCLLRERYQKIPILKIDYLFLLVFFDMMGVKFLQNFIIVLFTLKQILLDINKYCYSLSTNSYGTILPQKSLHAHPLIH